uniref:V-SNARE coiled-coil homology domain-containing protein n=1 Tax=Magallana gigas TaxID=29159 RepID=A0A8W8K4R1_MAGGI
MSHFLVSLFTRSAPPQNPVAGPGGPPMSAAGGPGGPQPAQPSKRLQQTQAQVDEVVDIMRVNVDKVLERDQKISELDDRADALQAGASQFEASAGKLKRKYWWKNCKMMIILGVIIAVIVIIIIDVVNSYCNHSYYNHNNCRLGCYKSTKQWRQYQQQWISQLHLSEHHPYF